MSKVLLTLVAVSFFSFVSWCIYYETTPEYRYPCIEGFKHERRHETRHNTTLRPILDQKTGQPVRCPRS